jgi:hypothetical protein
MFGTHDCSGSAHGGDGNSRASRKWIAEHVKHILKGSPTFRLIDVKKTMFREFGLRIDYQHAWWGKEIAQKDLYGPGRFSYDYLRWYKSKVEATNEGSVVILDPEDVGRFKRLFMCYHGC